MKEVAQVARSVDAVPKFSASDAASQREIAAEEAAIAERVAHGGFAGELGTDLPRAVWCVRSGVGWCAVRGGRRPGRSRDLVRTTCGANVPAGGAEVREADCLRCVAGVERRLGKAVGR